MTMNEIEQEKKEINEMRLKKKDEDETKQFLQIIQDFNQFQLKKEKERTEDERENLKRECSKLNKKIILFNILNLII